MESSIRGARFKPQLCHTMWFSAHYLSSSVKQDPGLLERLIEMMAVSGCSLSGLFLNKALCLPPAYSSIYLRHLVVLQNIRGPLVLYVPLPWGLFSPCSPSSIHPKCPLPPSVGYLLPSSGLSLGPCDLLLVREPHKENECSWFWIWAPLLSCNVILGKLLTFFKSLIVHP